MSATVSSSRTGAAGWTPASRSVELTGPAGRLEALLNTGAPNAPCAVLVCHPHPVYGGTMHNKVVYHAMKVFNDAAWGFGWPVLRFNFRGAGLSEGRHDGKAEAEDVLAALDWLDREYHLPIVAAGFSFGAAMTVSACCNQHATTGNIRALALLGLPIRVNSRDYHYTSLHQAACPKLFLSGDRDEFASTAQLAEIVASAAEPKRLILIPDSDHFFTGQLEPMQRSLAGWLKEQLP